MLTADLVKLRRRGDAALLPKLDLERLTAVADELVTCARNAVGEPRRALLQACEDVVCDDALVRRGLTKLMVDAVEFEEVQGEPVSARRLALFEAAATARRAGTFDRSALSVAAGLSSDPTVAELYSELPDESRILSTHRVPTPEGLVLRYRYALREAALLRAESLEVDLSMLGPAGKRRVFRALRFFGLMFLALSESATGGAAPPTAGPARILVDGPMSLFTGQTRYGLKLAWLLRLLHELGPFIVHAQVRMRGETRARLTLRHDDLEAVEPRDDPARQGDVAPEVTTLQRAAAARLAPPWRIDIAEDFVALGGGHVWLPDLTATHGARLRVDIEHFDKQQRDLFQKRCEQLHRTAGLPAIGTAARRALLIAPLSFVRAANAQLSPYVALLGYARVTSRDALIAQLVSLLDASP